jgi:phosphatidylinositol 3-kinase
MEKAKEKECEQKANVYPSLVVELCSFEHRVVFQVNCLTLLYIYVMV